MPVRVIKNPEFLRWSNFKTRPNKILDKRTNSLEEAYTRFHVTLPSGFIPKAMDGGLGLTFKDNWQITIKPDAEVWQGANKTAELLAHEQLHYFFGFVTARALVNDFLAIRVKNKNELKKAMGDLYDLHIMTRAAALNDQYEADTNHSANTSDQSKWEVAMDKCLLDDTATTLMGLDL
jgi:hypothetical protein